MKVRIVALVISLLLTPVIRAQSINCAGTQDSRLIIGEQALVIANGGSNLRARPYADATLLNVIPQNELIPVIDGPFCSGGYAWWQIDYEGDRGWVAEGTDEFYWIAPYIIQRAQIGTVRIEIQPNLVTGIVLERLADPLRSQFVLEGFPVASNQIVPFVVIFDEAPDGVSLDDVDGNAVAHVENLEMGARFVDIYFEEALGEDTEISLIYHYVAVTDDNRFIDAYFPISAPDLPLAYDDSEQYFENTIKALEVLSPDDFTPSLGQLDGIVRSIQPDAPLEESDLFTHSANGIQFTYNPVLATAISEVLIPESDTPEHVELNLDDFPTGDAIVHIYRAEDLDGSTLATLQQILSRKPNNPPHIPIVSHSENVSEREALQYLNFVNGEGISYIAVIGEGEQVYSFQGLSTNGDYFVSAILPVADKYPPVAILDDLIKSLKIGE